MHVFWENPDWPGAEVEPNITSLTWCAADGETRTNTDTTTSVVRLGRSGWLGCGSENGSVGITRTDTSLTASTSDGETEGKADSPATTTTTNNNMPARYNCNLRGHHNPILFVSWNREQKKLASCDDTGIIYVWVPYEDRWSVELVNDRGVKVRDFCWSPNGQSALICYEDNFVLIGSANGQRIWSNHYPNDQQMDSGAWSPDSRHVILGSKSGVLHVLSDQGAQFTEHTVLAGRPIEKTTWSPARDNDRSTICLYFGDGLLYFMRSFDDPDPTVVDTKLNVVSMEWSMDGEYLAVAGWKPLQTTAATTTTGASAASAVGGTKPPAEAAPASVAATTTTPPAVAKPVATAAAPGGDGRTRNYLMIFDGAGVELLNVLAPFGDQPCPPLTAMAWCEDAVVLAAGGQLRIGRIVGRGRVPSLAQLASYRVWRSTLPARAAHVEQDTLQQDDLVRLSARGRTNSSVIGQLPLPNRGIASVLQHDHHMIKCRIPDYEELLRVSCAPTKWRWYCTIRPSSRKAQAFELCMEHLGGMVPVLTGRQTNRLLPEFEIRMPRRRQRTMDDNNNTQSPSRSRSGTPDIEEGPSGSSSRRVGTTGEPSNANFQRNNVWRRSKKQFKAFVHKANLKYTGVTAERTSKREEKMVVVSSNVWCTRFKITGMSMRVLPPYLGQVLYKTSVLHLQPRQMTVHVVDLSRRSALPVPPPPNDPMADTDGATDGNLGVDGGPPVAPLDGEIFVGGGRNATATEQLALLEEQQVLRQVLGEFGDLRAAVDRHIVRMRDYAAELQRSSLQLRNTTTDPEGTNSGENSKPTNSSQQLVAQSMKNALQPQQQTSRDAAIASPIVTSKGMASSASTTVTSTATPTNKGKATNETATKPNASWERELDDLDYIDEDEELVITNEDEKRRLRARTLSASTADNGIPSTSAPHTTGANGIMNFPNDLESGFKRPPRYGSDRRSHSARGVVALQIDKLDFALQSGIFARQSTTQNASGSAKAQQPAPVSTSVVTTGTSSSVNGTNSLGGNSKQLKELAGVLEKLNKLASDLTARSAIGDATAASTGSTLIGSAGKVAPNLVGDPPSVRQQLPPTAEDGGDCEELQLLRGRVREMALRVGQLERRLNYGNELLDDVRGDLQRRVQNIRQALGEDSTSIDGGNGGTEAASSSRSDTTGGKGMMSATNGAANSAVGGGRRATKQHRIGQLKTTKSAPDAMLAGGDLGDATHTDAVLQLQNKTPFWNEQSQVYQLDFGGRVTQESAKNFQIEHEDRQVMQFGRIENGCYTLDFMGPFSAVQAFAVALASITQRLK